MLNSEGRCSILILITIWMFCVACSKKNVEPLDIYDDSNFFHEESDVMEDVESLFGGVKSFENNKGRCAIDWIDSSVYNTYVVYYDDTTCDGRWIWNGKVEINLSGGKWTDKGAVISIKMYNLKETNIANGNFTKMNGEKFITNISGGLADTLQNGSSVVRHVEGKNLVLYRYIDSDGTDYELKWNESRIKVIQKINDDLQFIYKGNGLGNTNTDIVSWGTYNKGADFYTFIESPLIYSKCNKLYRFTSGTKIVQTKKKTSTFTYGVDASGISVDDCSAYGYKLSWNKTSGESDQKIIKYKYTR